MAKDTFYFTHDYNARTDGKMKRLLAKHKMLGYGIFWAIIEDLYNNANALPTDYESIANDLRAPVEKIKSVVEDFGLFAIKDGFFGSHSVQKRLEERGNKSKKARDSAFARWGKDANALQPQSDRNAIKERKGKEKKGNKKPFTPPSLDEFKKYFSEHGFDETVAVRAWTGYNVADWHDTKGNKVKNWKQKCQNVWFTDENKIKSASPVAGTVKILEPQQDFRGK